MKSQQIFRTIIVLTIIGSFFLQQREPVCADEKAIKDMEGRTPYGLRINEVRKSFRHGNVRVDLIYSSIESDTEISAYLQGFFEELGKYIDYNIRRKKIRKSATFLISHCRFCTTGYCAKSGKKGVSLRLECRGKVQAKKLLDYELILNKKNHESMACKIIEEFFR